MTAAVYLPGADRLVLIDLTAWNPAAGATVALYVATEDYCTEPGDTPPNREYLGVIDGALSLRRSLFDGTRLGGRSIPALGSITLCNDGSLDTWLGYCWPGWPFTIRILRRGDSWSAAEVVAKGVVQDIDYTADTITILVADRQQIFAKPLARDKYAGTGGFEGGADLKDKYKPVGFGPVFNVTAVPVDPANGWYDLHTGVHSDPMMAVDSVEDKGVALTPSASNPPPPGCYYADLTNGRIRVTTSPVGPLTVSFRGSKTGGVYVSTAADIARRLVASFGGLADPGEIDTASIAALNTANSAAVGYWAGTDAVNLDEVLDTVLGSVGAAWGFTRKTDLFWVRRLEAPTATSETHSAVKLVLDDDDNNNIIKGTLRRISAGIPPHSVEVKYRFNYTVQEELDTNTTADHRVAVRDTYRSVRTAESAAVKAAYPTSQPLTVETRLDQTAAATAEGTRLAGLYGVHRDFWTAETFSEPLALELLDEGWLHHSRYNLAAGLGTRIVGIEETLRTGRCVLTLWG